MGDRAKVWVTTGLALVILGSTSASPATARATPLVPMPGERILTEAQQARALEGMPAAERERLEVIFDDSANYLPVAYTRAYFAVVTNADGTTALQQVGSFDDPGSNLRIPSGPTTSTTSASTSGTGGNGDLYMSVAVWRTSTPGVYEWGIENYFQWNGISNMDPCNAVEESFGTSWAGDLYLYSDNWTGWWYFDPSSVYMYRSDATPNEGVGWSFAEWQPWATSCDHVRQGRAAAYIRETSWQGRTDNVVHKYVHTKGGTGSYTLGFSNASITVSPNDSNQWSAAAYASFSH